MHCLHTIGQLTEGVPLAVSKIVDYSSLLHRGTKKARTRLFYVAITAAGRNPPHSQATLQYCNRVSSLGSSVAHLSCLVMPKTA